MTSPPTTDPATRRGYRWEIAVVLAVTFGLSGLRSLLSLIRAMLRPEPLASQTVAINAPESTNSLLGLAFELAGVLQLAAWGALGLVLLHHSGLGPRAIGLARDRLGGDAGLAVLLLVVIGVPGLGLYLLARSAGFNLTVAPSTLGDTWWRLPTLVLSAVANAWAEEVIVVGYLLTRLRQLGAGSVPALLGSAVLRGSYHLYQGFGGFLGNLAMGVIFARFWQRSRRLWPLVIAHALLDVVAFVGYALLADQLSWL